MSRKLSKLNLLLVSFGVSLLLVACGASTPNSVSLTATQGQCVTSQIPGYESVATANSAAYPMNAALPANSPYCVALTLTNNNSGKNSNNIQVSNSGLSISYAVVSGQNITSYMVDFNAAGVPQSSFPYTAYQQDGNIVLFDPNNCVTTIGAQVRTYTKGGGSCKFYLQLTGESLPIGVYPVSANVSYTNGNSNYSVSTPLNQRSNLYVGGNSNNNVVAITNAQSSNNAIVSANYPANNAVNAITRDPFGNVYVGDNTGSVYKYNGTSISSWTKMPTTATSQILAMASDSLGNIYFANVLGSVFQVSSSGTLMSMGTLSGIGSAYPTSMVVNGTILGIAVSNNTIYSCSLNPVSSTSCSVVPVSGPSGAGTIFQLMYNTAPVVATYNDIYTMVGASWQELYPGLAGDIVTSMAYYPGITTPVSVGASWFAAVNQDDVTPVNSSVFYESTVGGAFSPFAGSTGNIISGQNPLIALDSARGVFISATGLVSADFTGSNIYLAYIPASWLGVIGTPWTPITGVSAPIVAMQTASQLTPY